MENKEDESEEWHNPNAEDCILQPGQKRVRFSFCEPACPPPQWNEAFDDEESDDSASKEQTKFQQVRSRRRDSCYPAVILEDEDMDNSTITNLDDYSARNNQQLKDPESQGLQEKDPFEHLDLQEEPSTPWSDLTKEEKIHRVGLIIGKTIALLTLLYFFVCSLDLLSKGFRLVGGRTAGEIFKQSDILQNPVVGVMIGILTTVLVQSSSTSTSIIVGMVAAGFMDVKTAIPIIMGSNIGTSITNTIVSFMQAGNKEEFRRAFAGATILDMFNWITVIVLLVVEVLTGYLYHVTKAWVDVMVPDPEAVGDVKLLSALTEPFVNLIIQLDESVMDCWSNPNCTDRLNDSLIKKKCRITTARLDVSERQFDVNRSLVSSISQVSSHSTEHDCSNEFIFAGTSLSDFAVGIIILLSSLVVLCTCLILIVKLLSSVLRGHVSVMIKKVLNADIPYAPWITGYVAILVGALMTFLVQSSSVFTSALTPLVGLGVISLKRVYPLTLGANIGTTSTAVLASFAVEPRSFAPSMQIALCHLMFNVTGILLFYPIPFLRFPIQMAKCLGNTTAEYRWFALFYMVMMFVIVPAVFISLSFLGTIYVIILVSLIALLFCLIMVIKFVQKRFPQILPEVFRTWEWLPLPLRSLQPYDDVFSRFLCCQKAGKAEDYEDHSTEKTGNYIYYSGKEIIDKPSKTNSGNLPHNTMGSNKETVDYSNHWNVNGSIPPPVDDENNQFRNNTVVNGMQRNNNDNEDGSNEVVTTELGSDNEGGISRIHGLCDPIKVIMKFINLLIT